MARGIAEHPLGRLLDKTTFNTATGCWEWTASRTSGGYGAFRIPGVSSAHRAMYQFLVGPVPEGLHLDHLCRVRHCVNPDHLEPVTQAENNRRAAAAVTHCPKGHAYTEANTHLRKRGSRDCRVCNRDRANLRYHSRKVTSA